MMWVVQRVLVQYLAERTIQLRIMQLQAVRAFKIDLDTFRPKLLEVFNRVFRIQANGQDLLYMIDLITYGVELMERFPEIPVDIKGRFKVLVV